MTMKCPWSVDFVRRNMRLMTFSSAIRFRAFVLRESGKRPPQPGMMRLQLKHPFRGEVAIREPGSDIWTFREVVVREIYRGIVRRAVGCKYIVDLGANIGLTSRYLGAHFPGCQILAVEPDRDNVRMLRSNLQPLVEKGQCQILHAAAWGVDTEVDVGMPPRGCGFDSIRVSETSTERCSQRIRAYSIESLMQLAGFPRIDILKIDIEGAETELFRSGAQWLEHVNAIAIEFHQNSRVESEFDNCVRDRGFIVEDDEAPNTVLAVRPESEWIKR